MKNAILIAVIVAAFIIGFVIADYCELLLAIHKDGARSVRFHFKFQDLTNGKTLTGVTIESPGRSVITPNKTEASSDGIIHGVVMIGWGCKQTILFEKPNFYQSMKNKNIEFTFSHPSYRTETRTFTVKELKQTQTIELTASVK